MTSVLTLSSDDEETSPSPPDLGEVPLRTADKQEGTLSSGQGSQLPSDSEHFLENEEIVISDDEDDERNGAYPDIALDANVSSNVAPASAPATTPAATPASAPAAARASSNPESRMNMHQTSLILALLENMMIIHLNCIYIPIFYDIPKS